jgi:hypothetical protein
MNAQLSAQIATGATVFPSDVPRGTTPPPQMGQMSMVPPPGGPGHPGPHGTIPPDVSAPLGAPVPTPPGLPAQVGARGSEPAGMLDGYPPLAPLARPSDSGPLDAQHAAGVMSPVGQQYPESVDWSALAAGRARAVPPWLLAVLFLGAIGIALALTIAIARIVR